MSTSSVRSVSFAIGCALILACSGGVPTEKTLLQVAGIETADTTDVAGPFDTFGGILAVPSIDAKQPWQPIAGLTVDLVHREANDAHIVASAVTKSDGSFEMKNPTGAPFWEMFFRVVPPEGSGWSPNPLTPAFTTAPMNRDRNIILLERTEWRLRPELPMGRAHGFVLDAPVLGSSGPGVGGIIVTYQKIIRVTRNAAGERQVELAPEIDHGVTDANGRYLMAVRGGAGEYVVRYAAPPGYHVAWQPDNQEASTYWSSFDHPMVIRLGKSQP
jgi:hypothetical protein